jgi:hypothetical protein
MDTTMSHEVVTKFAEVEARLDALEAGSGGAKTTEEETTEEEAPPTRTARGRS